MGREPLQLGEYVISFTLTRGHSARLMGESEAAQQLAQGTYAGLMGEWSCRLSGAALLNLDSYVLSLHCIFLIQR